MNNNNVNSVPSTSTDAVPPKKRKMPVYVQPEPCIFNMNPSSLPPEAGFMNRKHPRLMKQPNVNLINLSNTKTNNKLKNAVQNNRKYTEYPVFSHNLNNVLNSTQQNPHLFKSTINLLRFNNTEPIDLKNDFVPPIRLVRKDITEIQTQQVANNDTENNDLNAELPDASKIAPYGGLAKTKQNYFQRKTKQVQLLTKKEKELIKEENNPWVLEDFENNNLNNNSNSWQGSLEGEKLGRYYAFVVDGNGFRAIKIDKHYTFNKKITYRTLTSEEAENIMNSNLKNKEISTTSASRWFMKIRDEKEKQNLKKTKSNSKKQLKQTKGHDNDQDEDTVYTKPKLKTVDTGEDMLDFDFDDDDIIASKKRKQKFSRDIEEMDYEEDVQDDDEGQIEYNDEEQKENNNRIKKEQMMVQHTGSANNNTNYYYSDNDDEFEDIMNQNNSLSNTGKEMKNLVKRFGKNDNTVVSDDDMEDPYALSSDYENNNDTEIETGEKNMDEKSAQLFRMEFEKALSNNDANEKTKKQNKSTIQPLKKSNIPKIHTSKDSKSSSPLGNNNVSSKKHETQKSPNPKIITAKSNEDNRKGSSENLLTESDVINAIKNKNSTISDLIALLRPKIKLNPENKKLASLFIKKVAFCENHIWKLKQEYKNN